MSGAVAVLRRVCLAEATTRQSSGRNGFDRATASYLAGMSTSPVSPEDIRAAAEAHAELEPEYNDAAAAAFVAAVDRQVAARVEARLAEIDRARPAVHESRWALFKGVAIGVCAGALTVAAIGLAVPRASSPQVGHNARVAPAGGPGSGPMHAQLLPYLRPGAPSPRRPTPVRHSR